jgi:hypothetical protein
MRFLAQILRPSFISSTAFGSRLFRASFHDLHEGVLYLPAARLSGLEDYPVVFDFLGQLSPDH